MRVEQLGRQDSNPGRDSGSWTPRGCVGRPVASEEGRPCPSLGSELRRRQRWAQKGENVQESDSEWQARGMGSKRRVVSGPSPPSRQGKRLGQPPLVRVEGSSAAACPGALSPTPLLAAHLGLRPTEAGGLRGLFLQSCFRARLCLRMDTKASRSLSCMRLGERPLGVGSALTLAKGRVPGQAGCQDRPWRLSLGESVVSEAVLQTPGQTARSHGETHKGLW